MATLTPELLKKRAEHNEGHLSTLEEIALYNEDIIRIENIQNCCKNLKILLLQGNVISKIENLWKLKKLEYLNLGLNNIEKIENLERCESLEKLDLTLNFIGDLKSVSHLKNNYNLNELCLIGNPCCDYTGYREYVIGTLPQLKVLDGKEIARSEKIIARDSLFNIALNIEEEQNKYFEKRNTERQQIISAEVEVTDDEHLSRKNIEQFWNAPSYHTPESRKAIAIQKQKQTEKKKIEIFTPKPKREIILFAKDGRPLNVNQPKIPFTLTESEDGFNFILTIEVYKYLETSALDVDVQPWFVRVLINRKILQLALQEEVQTDSSKAERSLYSNKLVITMPKMNTVGEDVTAPEIILKAEFWSVSNFLKCITWPDKWKIWCDKIFYSLEGLALVPLQAGGAIVASERTPASANHYRVCCGKMKFYFQRRYRSNYEKMNKLPYCS